MSQQFLCSFDLIFLIFRKRPKLKADEDVVVITDPQIYGSRKNRMKTLRRKPKSVETKKEVKVEEKPKRKAKRKRPKNENSGKDRKISILF